MDIYEITWKTSALWKKKIPTDVKRKFTSWNSRGRACDGHNATTLSRDKRQCFNFLPKAQLRNNHIVFLLSHLLQLIESFRVCLVKCTWDLRKLRNQKVEMHWKRLKSREIGKEKRDQKETNDRKMNRSPVCAQVHNFKFQSHQI